MSRAEPTSRIPRRKRRRWPRVLLIVGVLAAGVAAVPFVFTGAILRYYLAHGAYQRMPIRFSSASLSPSGAITLRDLAVDDTGESAGKPLVRAGKARVTFSWSSLFSDRVETILVEDAQVYLRPGADSSLTLLRLLAPPASQASAGAHATEPASASQATAGSKPIWFDQFLVLGHVHVEGYDPWQSLGQVAARDSFAAQLIAKSTGQAVNPSREVELVIGETDSATKPYLTARVTVSSTNAGTMLNAEWVTLGNISPALSEAFLDANASWLPASLRRPLGGHAEKLMVSGTMSIGKDIGVNANAELRDLSAKLAATNPADVPVSVDHATASVHVEGKVTATPLKDLTFTSARFGWDGAQIGDLHFQRANADLQVEGSEIVLKDLQTSIDDAPFSVTARYDSQTKVVSRASAWWNNIPVTKLLDRLPESARQSIPAALDGNISAQVSFVESSGGMLNFFVKATSPAEMRAALGPSNRRLRHGDPADVSLTNAALSANVFWSLHDQALARVANGRFTADDLLLYAPNSSEGIDLQDIKSDFSFDNHVARLADFYADLDGDGTLSIQPAAYSLTSRTLDNLEIDVKDAECSMFGPWMQGEKQINGLFNAQVRLAGSPAEKTCALSVALSPQVSLAVRGALAGTLTLEGKPALSLDAALDASNRVAVKAARVEGISKLQADAGIVELLRRVWWPEPGSDMAAWFQRFHDGATLSLGSAAFTGSIGASTPYLTSGTLTIENLGAAPLGENSGLPQIEKMGLSADLSLPLALTDLNGIRVSNGRVAAAKVTLGKNTASDVSAKLAAASSRIDLTGASLAYAGGTVNGDASFALPAGLASLHLTFGGVEQETLTQNLFPSVFTAQGPVSGTVSVSRGAKNQLVGDIEVHADKAGILKFSRSTSEKLFAPAVEQAASTGAGGAVLPDNVGDIIAAIFENYHYTKGNASIQDEGEGLKVVLNYDRVPAAPGDPGYGIPVTIQGQKVQENLNPNLRDYTLQLSMSVEELLETFTGSRSAATRPATQAQTMPDAGTTTRP